MRHYDISEASIPFSKLGDVSGMTFGFESEVVVRAGTFYHEVNFDDLYDEMYDEDGDGHQLLHDLGADKEVAKREFRDWKEETGQEDATIIDWMDAIGEEDWWKTIRADGNWRYALKDGHIVELMSWEYQADQFADEMREEFGYDITTAPSSETPLENKRGYEDWFIENDPSVSGSDENDICFEIVSPKFNSFDDFKQALSSLMEWLHSRYNGDIYTNQTTGLHINIGITNAASRIDPLKLLLFSGEAWMTRHWRDRHNQHTAELLPSLNAQGLPRSIDAARRFVSKFISELNDKAFAINLLTLINRGYVEFRPIGNAGYETRVEEIFQHINRFVQIINIAADPAAFRQEYAKKLAKLTGGGEAAAINSAPIGVRQVRQWLDALNLHPNEKQKIMDDKGNIIIDASMLIILVAFYSEKGSPVPMPIVKSLIRYGHINAAQYQEAIQELATRRWMIKPESIEVAQHILDPLLG